MTAPASHAAAPRGGGSLPNPILPRAATFLCAAALLAAAGCGARPEPPPPVEKATKVEALRLGPERVEEWIELPGSIEPIRAVSVSPEVGGLLELRPVDVGDAVAKGQRLALVDREHTELRLRQAELAAQAAAVGAERAKTGVEQAAIAVAASRSGVAQATAAASQAAEQEKKLRAVRDKARADLERARALFDEKLVPRAFLEGQETALAAAEADLATAAASVEAAAAGREAADHGQEAAIAGEKAANDEVRAAEARARSAAAAVEEARLMLRRSEVLSPLEGRVHHVLGEPGEVVEANKPLLTIVDTARVKAVFPLPERDVPFVRRGDPAEVAVASLGDGPRRGKVDLVAVAADPATSTYRVEVELPNPGGALRPGMLAKLRLLRRASDAAVVVPLFAVIRGGGRAYAFVAEEGVARRREVETGIVNGDRVEVVSGLAHGELLVVKGQRDLEDGLKVELP